MTTALASAAFVSAVSGDSLLITKLYISPTRLNLVLQSRLWERLDQGLSSCLILVSALAGFGKTTLVAMLHTQLAGPSSCDETGRSESCVGSLVNEIITVTSSDCHCRYTWSSWDNYSLG